MAVTPSESLSGTGRKGVDVAACGFREFPCLTLGFAFWRQRYVEKAVVVDVEVELSTQLMMDEMSYMVSGRGVNGVGRGEMQLGSGGHVMCLVDASFTSIVFSVPSSLSSGRRGAVTGTGGVLTLVDCCVELIEEGSSLSFSFISLPPIASARLMVMNSSFDAVSFSGGCIVESGSGGEIAVERTNFTSIRRANGNGSCVCVWSGDDVWIGVMRP
jgi:hypothetical protein